MDKSNILNLDEVFFKLLVEETFFINGRGVVACGRVNSGEISSDSDVAITDESGCITRYAKVSTIDYGFISKSPVPKSAKKDQNVGLLLKEIGLEEINRGNYIVIE
jgi:translation elongation factor EF-Tu-like GTPase